VPTSRDTRVTSSANADSWSTSMFTVCLSCSISPVASTVTLPVRSPRATAVVISAMSRTCAAVCAASEVTQASWPPTSSASCRISPSSGSAAVTASRSPAVSAHERKSPRANSASLARIGSRSASVYRAPPLADPLPPDPWLPLPPEPLPPEPLPERPPPPPLPSPVWFCLMTRELAVVSVIACPLLRPWPTLPGLAGAGLDCASRMCQCHESATIGTSAGSVCTGKACGRTPEPRRCRGL
jgi:hypothetical protein